MGYVAKIKKTMPCSTYYLNLSSSISQGQTKATRNFTVPRGLGLSCLEHVLLAKIISLISRLKDNGVTGCDCHEKGVGGTRVLPRAAGDQNSRACLGAFRLCLRARACS